MPEKKPFIGIDHGAHAIDLRHHGPSIQVRPDEIHVNSNGSIKDEPVFVFVCASTIGKKVFAQISLEMLNEGLADIGYKIEKI